jgi:hypothetical protein
MTSVVTVVLAVLFFSTAAGKLVGHPASLAIRDHLEVPAVRLQQIGILEVAGAGGGGRRRARRPRGGGAGPRGVLLGLALRPLGVVAATGLVLLSIGAIATLVRAGDEAIVALPALVALAVAAATLVLQVA